MIMQMEKQSKGAYQMYCEIEDLRTNLELMPSVIQLLVEKYNLDQENLTDEEKLDLSRANHDIYDVLALVQNTIFRFKQDMDDLWEKYKELPSETELKEGA